MHLLFGIGNCVGVGSADCLVDNELEGGGGEGREGGRTEGEVRTGFCYLIEEHVDISFLFLSTVRRIAVHRSVGRVNYRVDTDNRKTTVARDKRGGKEVVFGCGLWPGLAWGLF